MLRRVLGSLGLLALVVAGYVSYLFVRERALLFATPPPPERAADFVPPRVQRAWIKTSFGKVEAWWLEPSRSGDAPLVVFAHDKDQLIDDWSRPMEALRTVGVGVLLVEFPGFGHSDGRVSRASLKETFVAAFDWAVGQPGVDTWRVVAMGSGVGGGVAGELALERPVAALVLQSTFSSTEALMKERLRAPRLLVRDRFDNEGAVAAFAGPVLLLHGPEDDVIPFGHAERLAATRPALEVTRLSCAHADCIRDWSEVARHVRIFLEANDILR